MKRIKIMLTALTVLAVVGGALAFKAQKVDGFCYYSSSEAHDGNSPALFPFCNFHVAVGFKLGTPGGNNYATSAARVQGQCPTTITCTQKFASEEE